MREGRRRLSIEIGTKAAYIQFKMGKIAEPSDVPRLSRTRAAMVFIDNQTGLMASVETLHPERLKQHVLALRDVCRRVPVTGRPHCK
jgi:hypothetical protein